MVLLLPFHPQTLEVAHIETREVAIAKLGVLRKVYTLWSPQTHAFISQLNWPKEKQVCPWSPGASIHRVAVRACRTAANSCECRNSPRGTPEQKKPQACRQDVGLCGQEVSALIVGSTKARTSVTRQSCNTSFEGSNSLVDPVFIIPCSERLGEASVHLS
jgi:hypothetical protein